MKEVLKLNESEMNPSGCHGVKMLEGAGGLFEVKKFRSFFFLVIADKYILSADILFQHILQISSILKK